jgi:tagatose-6-phosphate ketose/aldose isomerase
VYLLGAGTSDYTGRALASLLRRRWGCDVWAIPSTTMLVDLEELNPPGRDYLWISFSRSGSSPEGVALLERAIEQRSDIRHMVITCNEQGEMAELCSRNADRALALILDDAVNDRGLAMTSSFTNMVLAGQCLANADRLTEFGETVAQLVEVGARFLPAAAEIAASIAELDCSRACFIGSGVLRAVADESALKLVEMSAGRVATMAETPLGLRHGPMSAVDGECLFVAFLSSDARRRGYELDLLEEVSRKRLGRVRAVVTSNATAGISALADYALSFDGASKSGGGVNGRPTLPDEYRPVVDVMLGQLLGLFASLRCGLKPDQPSPSGAITRVVAPIRLYS